MVRVKICGITNLKDAQTAVSYGAWALGFVFYKKSPRYISPQKAGAIIKKFTSFVTPVGVFVNEGRKSIEAVCEETGIRTIQLHGDEPPDFCGTFPGYKIIKAFRVGDSFHLKKILTFDVNAYLFDTYQEKFFGGTGKTFHWEILKGKKFKKPFILSGGLNPENIKSALRILRPFAVDVSSGVEKRPGLKDHGLMRDFFIVSETESFPHVIK